MRTLSFIILFITQNVRPEEAADISESEETTTTVYDVIINERDREINDIEINEIDSGSEDQDENDDSDEVDGDDDDRDDGERDTEGQRGGEDANKLLAAQVNAVHVLNMLKDLEEDMKEILKEKKSEQEESLESPEVLSDDDGEDIDAEIAELERSLAVLTARGEAVRQMIVEQTRLLLGEESRLSQAREERVREEIKQQTKTTSPSQSSLSAEQEEFLQDLLGLENVLTALRQTDRAVFRELRRRRKRPRTKSQLEREKSSDSILDQPAIVGLEDPLVVNLDADYDVPTIIVQEEDLGDEVVVEYEDEVPLLLPQPPRPPPALHGHFLYHHPAPPVPRHHDHPTRYYAQPRPRYPGHYGRVEDHQYYPPQYETLYQGEPHITLTGSLLSGFENLGRGFQR